MEKNTGFWMKTTSTLPKLVWKSFTSSSDESDEPLYTSRDENMRWFEKKMCEKAGCTAFNQY